MASAAAWLQHLSAIDAQALPQHVVFTTSFGLEDQVLTHALVQAGWASRVRFATLDTGRLFAQTYDVWQKTQQQYGIAIEAFVPDTAQTEALVAANGINGFYNSVQARQQCCAVRKIHGLQRALQGARYWLTGLRANQSANRQAMDAVAWDAAYNVQKINPLWHSTRPELAQYAQQHNVPINVLHHQGFVSIGCAPCTRAIDGHEDERAGRWWWEDDAKKECGLHNRPNAGGTQ